MEISWTGTTTEAEADALLEAVRKIMAETNLPFHKALDIYICERHLDKNTGDVVPCPTDRGTQP